MTVASRKAARKGSGGGIKIGLGILIAVLLAMGDTAGQLAANERLMRLATGPDVLAFQSHFVVRNVGAYAGGVGASSLVMLLGGWPAFALLFVAAGASRFAAARATEVPEQPVTTDTQASIRLA